MGDDWSVKGKGRGNPRRRPTDWLCDSCSKKDEPTFVYAAHTHCLRCFKPRGNKATLYSETREYKAAQAKNGKGDGKGGKGGAKGDKGGDGEGPQARALRLRKLELSEKAAKAELDALDAADQSADAQMPAAASEAGGTDVKQIERDLAFRRGDLKTWTEQLARPGRENDELLKAGVKQAEQDIEKFTVLLREAKTPIEQFCAKGTRAKKLEKALPAMFVELRVVQEAEADARKRVAIHAQKAADIAKEIADTKKEINDLAKQAFSLNVGGHSDETQPKQGLQAMFGTTTKQFLESFDQSIFKGNQAVAEKKAEMVEMVRIISEGIARMELPLPGHRSSQSEECDRLVRPRNPGKPENAF